MKIKNMDKKVGCKQCGICCRWVYITTIGPRYDLTELDQFRGYERVDDTTVRLPCPCGKLDLETNQCKVYDTRPEVCRLYPKIGGYPIPEECTYED